MRYFCFASNITRDGKANASAWELRHQNGPYNGVLIPFGALCDFKPSPVAIKLRQGQFEPRAIPGIFLGWPVLPGGV